jgi:hypothetical protein
MLMKAMQFFKSWGWSIESQLKKPKKKKKEKKRTM